MVAWSSILFRNISKTNPLKNIFNSSKSKWRNEVISQLPCRNSSSHNQIHVRTTLYPLAKLKDLLIFYFLLGAIPLGLLVTYVNVFIGPAKLALIPEGYEPKHWEYYEHPISRFMARYILASPQEVYERNLHHIQINLEDAQRSKLKNKISNLMKVRQDYQAWYFMKPMTKHQRFEAETRESFKDRENISRGGFSI